MKQKLKMKMTRPKSTLITAKKQCVMYQVPVGKPQTSQSTPLEMKEVTHGCIIYSKAEYMDPLQEYAPVKIFGDNQGTIALTMDPVH